ncbi:MAG TPA: RodZ domain-containing protein [Halanaerobiales bacterium]|nr:RodZ domain-containing protein [Halanaerobiales bacterium]
MLIGEKLKKAREEKEYTLEDVRDSIKIRIRYLKAIEENNFEEIPGKAYIRAFIKSYAEYLGLDVVELIEEYEQKLLEEKKKREEELEKEEGQKKDFLHNKTVITSLIIIIIMIVLAFIVYSIFLLNDSRNEMNGMPSDQYVLPVTQEIDSNSGLSSEELSQGNHELNELEEIIEETPIDRQIINNAEEDIDEDLNDSINAIKEIEITARERTWIRISVDGEEKYEGIMEKGDSKNYAGNKFLEMRIGNAAGIIVKNGDEVIGPWGKSGEVITKELDL